MSKNDVGTEGLIGTGVPFRKQLSGHLRNGTRSNGTAGKPGTRWTIKEFADKTGVDPRSVRYWLNGKRCPDDLRSVERALFGSSPAYGSERLQLREAFDTAAGRKTRAPADSRLIPPSRCFGREADVAAVMAVLTGPCAVAVLGPPGIGKTTLTHQVTADPAMIERFGKRRWWVELETARDAAALRTAIIVALSLNPVSRSFRDALARLGKEPSLLVLDNLETPWEQDMSAVQDCLRQLIAVPTVTLLVSMRGNVAPTAPPFALRLTLNPLAAADAQHLFLDLAPNISATDPQLEPFLHELGGVPLAVELVAYRAAPHDVLRDLWEEWQRRGVLLATHPDLLEGRLTSVVRSIDLSLQSRRLYDEGRYLFCLLGQLPGGMAQKDCAALLSEDAAKAKGQLLATGLAFSREQGRLDLLPPVRDYARRILVPLEAAEVDRWSRHYLTLVSTLGLHIGAPGGAEASARLTPEIANLEAAFVAARTPTGRQTAAAAMRGFAELVRFTGMSDAAPLFSLAEAYRAADDPDNEADCIRLIGDIMRDRSHHEAAEAAYRQAMLLFQQAGNARGEAICIQSIGDFMLLRQDYNAAQMAFEQALQLFDQIKDVKGIAVCIKKLGEIASAQSDHETAHTRFELARTVFRKIGDPLSEADCIQSIGDIALARLEHDKAQTAYEQALILFRQTGALLGEANCIRNLGEIAHFRSDYDAAHTAYEQARLIYRQVGSVLGEANCIKSLGDIAFVCSDHGSACAAYEEAKSLYQQIGDIVSEANCIRNLGGVAAACSDEDTARAAYEQALSLYVNVGEPLCTGITCYLLAKLSKGELRTAYIDVARETWTSINRPDLLARLDKLG